MSEPASKQAHLEQLLEQGMVMVHLDARRPGVDVPPHLREEASLALNLSHRFGLEHFRVDEGGVQARLSFQGTRYDCVLPWPSIYAMTSHADGRTRVFPADVPAELRQQMLAGAPEPEPPEPPRPRPALRLVK